MKALLAAPVTVVAMFVALLGSPIRRIPLLPIRADPGAGAANPPNPLASIHRPHRVGAVGTA